MAAPGGVNLSTQIPSQPPLPPEGIENIWSVVFTGVTVQMASHILDQLVMALAISTVNDCTTRGVLDYAAVKDTLHSAGSKCSKRGKEFDFNERESSVMSILHGIALCDPLPINTNNNKRLDSIEEICRHTVNAVAMRDRCRNNFRVWGLIDKRWKFRESALFTEAVNNVQRLYNLECEMKHEQLRDEMQKLKVAAVHEICVSLGVGWSLFQNMEDCGYLFCDEGGNDYCFWTTKDNLTAYDLIEYLSNSRHFTAHYRTLSDGPGDIKTFMNQFISTEELLNWYFQKVTDPQMPCHVRRTYIRYLFPGIVDSREELGRKLCNCYSDLEAIMDNRSELAEDKQNLTKRVCSLEEEKQQMDLKIWSVITQYYLNRDRPTVADDAIYEELLLLIQNHENITSNHPEDGKPLEDLKSLHELDLTSTKEADASAPEVEAQDNFRLPTGYVRPAGRNRKKAN